MVRALQGAWACGAERRGHLVDVHAVLGPDLSQGPGAVPDGGDHGLKIDHSPCDATVDMCAQSGQLCRRLLKAPRKQLLAHVIQRRLPQPGSERVQRFSEKPERLHADHSRCECEQGKMGRRERKEERKKGKKKGKMV